MKNKHLLLLVTVLVGLAAYLVLFYTTRLGSLEGVRASDIQPGDWLATTSENTPLMAERDALLFLANDTKLRADRIDGDLVAVTVMQGGKQITGWVHQQYLGRVFRRAYFFTWLLLPDELLAQWGGTPSEFAVLDRIPVLAIAGVIVAYAFILGWLLMTLLRVDRGLARLETFVFATAVGLNAVSTYVLLVGLLGLCRNVLMFVVPAALTLAAAAWLSLRGGRKTTWGLSRFSRSENGTVPFRNREVISRPILRPNARATCPNEAALSDNWLSPRWLWLAAPFVVVIVLGGMLPPVEFDVREYHLQVPKEFFQQGYVGFLPHNVYGNMPMGTEMFSLLAMVLSGDWWLGALAGKTVIAAFAPLTALALVAAGRRFFSLSVGVVAAIVYISIPWIAQVSSLGLVEGASACYLFLALYAVLLARREKKGERHLMSQPRLLLAGYLAGGAVACKYPAVLFVLVPLAAWILFGERRQLSMAWKPLGVFLLAVVLGCGLWFGKNWAATGNPTYPLLYETFGDSTSTWTPDKNRQWNNVHRPKDFSPRTLARHAARVVLRSEWLSPLVIPLAALAFIVRRKRRLSLVLLAYFGYVIVGWWLLTHRIDRFWIPVLPAVALLAGVGACWSRQTAWRRVLVGLLVFGSISNFLVTTSVAGGYNRYFVSLRRLRDDPMRLDAWHRYFNAHARDGRVLIVGDAQVFDLEVPILYSTCFDDSIFERLATGRTAEEVRAGLVGEGISHVYVHWGEIDRYRRPGNYGFTAFVQPAVFEWLVDQGILERLPKIEPHRGEGYRVVVRADRTDGS